MFTHLILHRRKLLLIALLAVASLLASLWLGDIKPLAEVDWLDVVARVVPVWPWRCGWY